MSLVMLPFTILFGGVLLLITVVNDRVPMAGVGVVGASVAALLTLTLPRTVRGYFLRKPVPPQVWPVPGHPWGPGHPPA